MAQKDDKDKKDEEAKDAGTSNTKVIILAAVISMLLGGGLVGAAMFFLGGSDGAPETEVAADGDEDADEEAGAEGAEVDLTAPAKYEPMDPKFVVGFHDQRQARFMQFSLQVMTREDSVINDIKTHMPAIRSSLLLLVGSQQYESVSSREGKERLLADITKDINSTLEKAGANAGVEASYFDSFVIQ